MMLIVLVPGPLKNNCSTSRLLHSAQAHAFVFLLLDAPHILSLPTLSSELYLSKPTALQGKIPANFSEKPLFSPCWESVGQHGGCLLRVQTLSAVYELVSRKNAQNIKMCQQQLFLGGHIFVSLSYWLSLKLFVCKNSLTVNLYIPQIA